VPAKGPVGSKAPAHRPPLKWQAIAIDRCSDAQKKRRASVDGRWCASGRDANPGCRLFGNGSILRAALRGCQCCVPGIVHWDALHTPAGLRSDSL